jgi:hypothetical protein
MTTLNLVLTNEINDILEERQKQKELEDAEGSDQDNENQEDMDAIAEDAGDDDQEANKEEAAGDGKSKTTPAAAGNESQRDSVNKDSMDENAPAQNKKTLKGTAQLKLSPDEQKRRLLVDLFGNDFKPDEKFNKAIEAAQEDIRLRRIQQ